MAWQPDKDLVAISHVAMLADSERPEYLASHPELVSRAAGDWALQVSRTNRAGGDRHRQYDYAAVALHIASALEDATLAIRACGELAEAAEAIGDAKEAAQFKALAVKIDSDARGK